MAKGPNRKKVSLDELATGRLPAKVVKAIDEMQITVGDMLQWDASKPKVKVSMRDGNIQIETRVKLSVGKAKKIAVGILGFSLAISPIAHKVWTEVQTILKL